MKDKILVAGLIGILILVAVLIGIVFSSSPGLEGKLLAAAPSLGNNFAPLQQDRHVSVETFHQSLASHGSWITHEKYGEVWRPSGVSVRWRPYTEGRWVYSDYGWAWDSDEDWGWATYHYGRWFFDEKDGWCWIPGTDWGPAWVSWRFGAGWIGWAPLAPEIVWDNGLTYSGADFDNYIPPFWYCFVEERYFVAPRIRDHIAISARNVTLVKLTQNVTRYEVSNNRVINRGVDVGRIEKDTRQTIKQYKVVDADSPRAGRQARGKGNELPIYNPAVSKSSPEGTRRQPSSAQTPPSANPNDLSGDTGKQRKAGKGSQKQATGTVQGQSNQPQSQGNTPQDNGKRQMKGKSADNRQQNDDLGAAQTTHAPKDNGTAADMARRQQQEQRQLQKQQQDEAKKLQKQHDQEKVRPPAGSSTGDLGKRQEEERRALGENAQRESQLLNNRHTTERSSGANMSRANMGGSNKGGRRRP